MLAALLGIAGCKGGGDDVICMYGVPTMSLTAATDKDGMENGGQFAESSTLLKDIQPIKDPEDTKNPFDLGTVKMEVPTVMMKAE